MIADIIEIVLAKIGRWLHWHGRNMLEGAVSSATRMGFEKVSDKIRDSLPDAIREPMETYLGGCLYALRWIWPLPVITLYFLGFVDYSRPTGQRIYWPAVIGIGLACLALTLVARSVARLTCAKAWLLGLNMVIIPSTIVTMTLLRLPLPVVLWFIAWWEVAFVVVIFSVKGLDDVNEGDYLNGFVCLAPFILALLALFFFGHNIAAAQFQYRKSISKYFLYGSDEKELSQFAAAPTGDNLDSLGREIGRRLKQVTAKYSSDRFTADQLHEALDEAYEQVFHRYGSDVESTLAFYSSKLLKRSVSGIEKEAMVGIIGLCLPNLELLQRTGIVTKQTAENVQKAMAAEAKKS